MMQLISIKLVDASPGEPIEEVILAAAEIAHADAAEHYGDAAGCRFTAFSPETTQSREELAEFVADYPGRRKLMQEWDLCRRPVAIAHWWDIDDEKIH
jgi:hypothetical protein